VEELIGADTVNTMPVPTLNAFRDHGRVRGATLLDGVEQARGDLQRLARLGIDLAAVTEQLQEEGVGLFQESMDKLLGSLGKKRDVYV
jgi:transaldolase